MLFFIYNGYCNYSPCLLLSFMTPNSLTISFFESVISLISEQKQI